LVAIPLAALRGAPRSHESLTLSADQPAAKVTRRPAAPVAPVAAAHTERLAEVDTGRASRSSGSLRREIEQLPIESFASTTTTSPTTVVVRRQAPTTTAPPETSTTAKPAPTTTAPPKPAPAPAAAPEGNSQSGKASWYEAAPAGTCAHRTLPKGTIVTVTHTGNGKSVTCRVADRGPYVDGWIIDLSKDTFSQLAPTSAGVIPVRITW
jgi:rare lipoprotein A